MVTRVKPVAGGRGRLGRAAGPQETYPGLAPQRLASSSVRSCLPQQQREELALGLFFLDDVRPTLGLGWQGCDEASTRRPPLLCPPGADPALQRALPGASGRTSCLSAMWAATVMSRLWQMGPRRPRCRLSPALPTGGHTAVGRQPPGLTKHCAQRPSLEGRGHRISFSGSSGIPGHRSGSLLPPGRTAEETHFRHTEPGVLAPSPRPPLGEHRAASSQQRASEGHGRSRGWAGWGRRGHRGPSAATAWPLQVCHS